MTTPTLFSSRYNGTSADFRNCKVDRSGAERREYFTITVPSGTAVGTIIGVVPFQAGAKYGGATLFTDALGTGVTCDFGYVYADNANYTDAPAAGGTGGSLATAGNVSLVVTNVRTILAWKAGQVPAGTGATMDSGVIANGYITIRITGAATTAAGVIDGQINMFYDQP